MSLTLIETLAHSYRASMAAGREVVPCGPYLAFFAPDSTDYLLNGAAPLSGDAAQPDAIDRLDRLFRDRGRLLRLEFFAEQFPDLQAVLLQAGVEVDMVAPVSVLKPDQLSTGPSAGRLITADDILGLEAAERVQAFAYGDDLTPEAQAGFRPILIDGLTRGQFHLALLDVAGEPVATATLIAGDGIAEMVGVATLPGRNGQGFASQICRFLLQSYFAKGHPMVWLSAGPQVRTLYARLGFRPLATQISMGRKIGGVGCH